MYYRYWYGVIHTSSLDLASLSVPLLGWISREIGLKCPRMRCREYSTVRMQCNHPPAVRAPAPPTPWTRLRRRRLLLRWPRAARMLAALGTTAHTSAEAAASARRILRVSWRHGVSRLAPAGTAIDEGAGIAAIPPVSVSRGRGPSCVAASWTTHACRLPAACCRAAQRLPQSTACMQMHCPRQRVRHSSLVAQKSPHFRGCGHRAAAALRSRLFPGGATSARRAPR